MPEFTQFDSEKSMIRYLPPKGRAGLARLRVRWRSRSPRPPAMTTAIVLLVSWLTKRPDFLGFTGGGASGCAVVNGAFEMQYNPRQFKALSQPETLLMTPPVHET